MRGINMQSTSQQGHFLNDEQKKVKAQIMEDLFKAWFSNLEKNMELFKDFQSMLDLSFSILVMFNRDALIHIIKTFNLEGHRKQIMKDLFEQIRNLVNNNIKKGMQ